jgi:putative transposase
VKAHICNDINEYKWSSHYFYNNYVKSHVNIDFILRMLGNSRKSAVEKYLKLVSSIGYENDNDKDYEIIKQELNIKETPFLNSNKENCTLEKLNRTTLDEIIMNLNVDESELLGIRNGNRKPVFTPVKIGIIKSALEQCYSLKEIADFLNAAPSTISKLISRNKII